MTSLRFACIFATLASVLVLAQSGRAPLVIQPNGPSIAEQRQRLLAIPRGRARSTQLNTHRRESLPTPNGLNFAPAVDYSSGGQFPSSVAVADVNGDGKPDLIVANEDSANVGVLLGNGDGTFQTPVTYASGGYNAVSVAVADVNGDGKPDIVVAIGCNDNDCNNGAVGVLLGNGDGTFQPSVTYSSGGYNAASVAVADVNGDGRPDIIVTDLCADDNCRDLGLVGVLLGNGDGTFQTAVTYGSGGGWTESVAVADVNGDGKPDLVVGNYCVGIFNQCGTGGESNGTLGVLLGNGDGTFQTVVTYGSGGYGATSVAVADVNGDGKPDVLVADACPLNCEGSTGEVGVLLGNGDGTFQTVVPYSSGGWEANSVAVADVNGDGKPDIVLANVCANETNCDGADGVQGAAGVLLGNGDGTFQTAVIYGSGGWDTYSVAVADVNGDGKPDVLMSSACGGTCTGEEGVIGVLLNTSLTATMTALSSSPNPSGFGQAVTLTAAVTAQPGFDKGTPTGTVSFLNGGTNIGNSNLNSSGVATLMTSTLPVGTDSITATYNGDTNFAPSTSPPLYQVVQGAVTAFSPASLNFGNETVGIPSTPQNVMLTNTGNINLSISLIQITGANMSDFSETNNCPASLAPNSSCNIAVTFTPMATGTRNAAVSVSDNAPNSPQSVPLTGTGIASVVTFSPTNLNFGNQPVGTTSNPLPVKLSTNGTLNISSISTSAQFNQTNNCPSQLPPGGSCTVNVTFTPSAPGLQNGTLSVSDDGQKSPQTVPLSGTGTQPAVGFNPPNLNFGNQTVGIKSSALVSTLTNTGSGTLSITMIQVTGANSGDFSEMNNCPGSLPPNGSCNISVTFTPKTTGTRNAAVSVTDNAPGSPQSLPLTGVGVLPAVTFNPTSLTFPTTVVYTTSASQKLTLTNTGLGILEIKSAKISSQFGVTTTCGKTLASGASCTAEVKFRPTTKGQISGSITITDNAPDSPEQVPLSGTGTFVKLSPTSLNFGNQPVNTTSPPKYITLENEGTAPVNFTGSGITITGADPGDFGEQNNCPNSLPSGSYCTIKVSFTPTQQGKRTADVSVSDDGGGSPQMVPLTGTGTP